MFNRLLFRAQVPHGSALWPPPSFSPSSVDQCCKQLDSCRKACGHAVENIPPPSLPHRHSWHSPAWKSRAANPARSHHHTPAKPPQPVRHCTSAALPSPLMKCVFSAGTTGVVSKKDNTSICSHFHHHARVRGVWQGWPALTAARLAESSFSRIGDRCQCWQAKASRPPRRGHRGSGPRQGRTKDHQVRRLGEILKQVLNKASPAAAITLCNKPGKERTLPPRPGQCRELLPALTGGGMDLAPVTARQGFPRASRHPPGQARS